MIAKAASVKRHLSRIGKKADVDLELFLVELDIQESVLFNLRMAIQNCIDIAAHIVKPTKVWRLGGELCNPNKPGFPEPPRPS
jgi:uncharacterized protein YutE (UPF0331/DUF86 family)